MRALFLFLVVVVAFLLVLRFYPTGGVEADEPDGGAQRVEERPAPEPRADPPQAASGGARFLTRPEGLESPLREERPAPSRPAVTGSEPAPAPEGDAGLPSWLADIEAAPAPRAGVAEESLARLLAHGALADVARALGDPDLGWSDERCLMVLAFKEALEGRRDQALEHLERLGDGDLEWSGGDQERVRAALTGSAPGLSLRAAREEGVVALAMEMALAAREAPLLLQERDFARAAGLFSGLLLNELDAPWDADRAALRAWSDGLRRAQDEHRLSPRGSWPGVEMVVEPGDSLVAIRKRYVERYPDRLMCAELIGFVNDARSVIHPGQKLRVPTDRVELLVDLDARWVVLLMGGEAVRAWEVGVGREGEETIEGSFYLYEKQENPAWFRRGKPMVPFGDPENPLGTRWMAWARTGDEKKTNYGFHGTNDPASIGKAASDGCIRFRNADVEELYELAPLGTPILVRR